MTANKSASRLLAVAAITLGFAAHAFTGHAFAGDAIQGDASISGAAKVTNGSYVPGKDEMRSGFVD